MINKRFCTILVFILLLMCPITVYTDVIIFSDFFDLNKSKTKPNGDRFIINSSLGYVIPKIEPGSENGIMYSEFYNWDIWRDSGFEFSEDDEWTIANGEIVTVKATFFHGGEHWGVIRLPIAARVNGERAYTAWISMDDLLMIYDRRHFEEENKNNFYTYTGSYDAILSAKRLVQWQWPGSDREKMVWDGENKEGFSILYAYKDEEGREWGKAKFKERYTWQGTKFWRDVEWWICLSDPENSSSIPAFNPTPEPQKWSPENSPQTEVPGNRSRRAGCGSAPPK